jgi:hypothetical protein
MIFHISSAAFADNTPLILPPRHICRRRHSHLHFDIFSDITPYHIFIVFIFDFHFHDRIDAIDILYFDDITERHFTPQRFLPMPTPPLFSPHSSRFISPRAAVRVVRFRYCAMPIFHRRLIISPFSHFADSCFSYADISFAAIGHFAARLIAPSPHSAFRFDFRQPPFQLRH